MRAKCPPGPGTPGATEAGRDNFHTPLRVRPGHLSFFVVRHLA